MGLNVAIVGAGRMAREHARAFAAVDGVRVAGIHSRTRPRAETLAAELRIPHVCDSIGELHERTGAGLVVVTVPETAALQVALRCLEQPWLVLLEKPPGLTPAEARRIEAAARAANRDVRVGLNRQFLGATQRVLRGLAGHAGARFVRVQDQQNLTQARLLGHPPAVLHHWMYANSIHLLDYFRLFGRGRLTSVENVFPWTPDNPGAVVAALCFDSGDSGLYEATWTAPGPWAATVAVAGHRWELRPLEQVASQELGQPTQTFAVEGWDLEFKPGFRLQAERVAEAALGRASDAPTLAEAIRTMDLIAAVYEAVPEAR